MAGQHCMGAFSAHRQGGILQVANGHLQDLLLCAMVQRNGHMDSGDGDIAHHAVAMSLIKVHSHCYQKHDFFEKVLNILCNCPQDFVHNV